MDGHTDRQTGRQTDKQIEPASQTGKQTMGREGAGMGWGSKLVRQTNLDEEPGGDKCQSTVLSIEAVMVSIKCKVVQIEEPAVTAKEIHYIIEYRGGGGSFFIFFKNSRRAEFKEEQIVQTL